MKKAIISIFAIIAIALALYGLYSLEKYSNQKPVRQDKEIR